MKRLIALSILALAEFVHQRVFNEPLSSVDGKLLLIAGIAFLSHIKFEQSSMNVAYLIEQKVGISCVKNSRTIGALGILSIYAVYQVIQENWVL